MRKTNHIIFMTAVIAALAIFTSCKKDNPEAPHNPTEETLSPKSFEVSLTEERQTKTFTWDVSASGSTDNHEESIKDLYVTKYNSVILNATADVNVKAETPAVVSVTRLNNRTYTLEYKSDGQTKITVWNGNGSSRFERSFRVYGKEYIDITGVKFLWYKYDKATKTCSDAIISINHFKDKPIELGDNVYREPRMGNLQDVESKSDFILDSDYNDWNNRFVIGINDEGLWDLLDRKMYGHEMKFLGFEPENTSFRHVLGFQSDYMGEGRYRDMVNAGQIKWGEYEWLNNDKTNCDVDDLKGIEAYLGSEGRFSNQPFYMAVLTVDADKKRYYYFYHSMNSDPEPTEDDIPEMFR